MRDRTFGIALLIAILTGLGLSALLHDRLVAFAEAPTVTTPTAVTQPIAAVVAAPVVSIDARLHALEAEIDLLRTQVTRLEHRR